MRITVTRRQPSPLCTQGNMVTDVGFSCDTLEPHPTTPANIGHPLVAAGGPFRVVIVKSIKFQRIMPLVTGIPGRTAIEIHWGDFPKDTEGCLMVGVAGPGPDRISSSRATFDKLFNLITANRDDCWITYVGP